MWNNIRLSFGSLLLGLSLLVNAEAGFIQPVSISADAPNNFNTPDVLIDAATGSGGASYVAPAPGSGGGGTSWYTASGGTTPVTLTFDFASSSPYEFLQDLYVWDYYTHTPTSWNLKLFDGPGATGTQLVDHDFSIVVGPSGTSTQHVIDFLDVSNVQSGTLTTLVNSASGGVGLAEIGFENLVVPAPIPEPSSLLLLGLGVLGLTRRVRRQSKCNR